MFKRLKEYPKAVLARRGLIVLAVLVFVLITSIILVNLYKVSHQPVGNTKQPEQQAVNNTADAGATGWYKGRKMQAANQPQAAQINATPTQQPQPINSAQQEAQGQPSSQQKQQDEQEREFYKKAMSAPITTNQLTNQQETSAMSAAAPSSQSSMPNGGMAMPGNANDQNMQAAKKAFLQENSQAMSDNYLHATLKNPISPYEVKAGTIIPGILITGLNSDLPGQITAQVRSNVYDTISGKYLLIPQGAKLTGLYDSQVAYGQERVLVVWRRIIFPNGKSIDLQGMPGVDLSGYAGFKDQVNNHYGKIFGSVLLMSVLSAGAQLSQPQQTQNPFQPPTVNQTLAQSLGTNLANTGMMITSKNINIQPTLEIRPGYLFNISVTKDMVFPGAYSSEVEISN